MDLRLFSSRDTPWLGFFSYLFLGLEDVAAEDVALSVSGDVTENLQILGVVRHVEYPERRNEMGQQNKTWIQDWQHFLNGSSETQQALSLFHCSFSTTTFQKNPASGLRLTSCSVSVIKCIRHSVLETTFSTSRWTQSMKKYCKEYTSMWEEKTEAMKTRTQKERNPV